MKVKLINKDTNDIKEAPVGFSWTTLLFGCLPALFRSDFKWAFIIFICSVLTYGYSNLIFAFIYNDLYIKKLEKQGYSRVD